MLKLIAIFTLVLLGSGWMSYSTSYFYNSPNWGVPFQKVEVVGEDLPDASKLPAQISKLNLEVKTLVEQEKYLYNMLFNATVDLEKKSHLNLSLIDKIGPLANLDLRDLTRTAEAITNAAGYSANLPADSNLREAMSTLQVSLRKTEEFKFQYLEKLSKWRTERPIQQDYQEVEIITPPPPSDDPFADQTPTVRYEQRPIWFRTWNISVEDGLLLGKAHWLMADIAVTQAKMAKDVSLIVKKYEALDTFENPTKTKKNFLFLQNKSKPIVSVGQLLYTCKVGLLWCSPVGSVKSIYTEPYQASLKPSGKTADGFLVEIELLDQRTINEEVIHVLNPDPI